MSSYFANANNVVAKKLTFNSYISDGDALQFLYNHSARGAMHDSDERFPPPMCHPGTRQAVEARITAWYGYLTGPQKRIMWVHAPAGYGKTAIAGTISKILEEQEGLDFCPLGATFFFWRTSPDRNSPACFIVTIAYQLAMSIPELKPHIENAVKKNPMILSKALEAQLVKLIVEPFKALGQYVEEMPNRLIIVDGLDECINSNRESRVGKQYAEDQEKVQIRVLDLIYTLQSHQLPLSFLVLSRPESWIKQHIRSYPFKESVEILDLYEVGDHMNDVEAYIRAELSRIASTIDRQTNDGDEEWPGENLVSRFVERTNGHMLYASTVLGHIDDPYDDPRSRLDNILNYSLLESDLAHSTPFSSLYQLYRQILQSCPKNTLPLMIEVLEDAVAMSICCHEQSLPHTLPILDSLSGRAAGSGVRALRGLHALLYLQTPNDPKPFAPAQEWFVHSSFMTFLHNPQFSLEFTAKGIKGHRRLLSGCLNALATVTRQSVDEKHQRFALTRILWLDLWFNLGCWEPENFDEEQYLSMVRKLLECDLEACFLKAFINRHRDQDFLYFSYNAKYFYTPGRRNSIVPPFSRQLYDSNDLVRQAVSRIVTSAEDAFAVLISQISTTDDVHLLAWVFVLRLRQYMVQNDEHVKDWGSNKVIQALKKLRREKRTPFDFLVERLVMVGDSPDDSPDDGESLKLKDVIDYLRDVC